MVVIEGFPEKGSNLLFNNKQIIIMPFFQEILHYCCGKTEKEFFLKYFGSHESLTFLGSGTTPSYLVIAPTALFG